MTTGIVDLFLRVEMLHSRYCKRENIQARNAFYVNISLSCTTMQDRLALRWLVWYYSVANYGKSVYRSMIGELPKQMISGTGHNARRRINSHLFP
jgi:hypothetical protein